MRRTKRLSSLCSIRVDALRAAFVERAHGEDAFHLRSMKHEVTPGFALAESTEEHAPVISR